MVFLDHDSLLSTDGSESNGATYQMPLRSDLGAQSYSLHIAEAGY